MAEECEKSLRRMNTDYLDILAIHWPLAETPMQETMAGFQQLIDAGKIRYAGVCNYTKPQLEEMLKYGSLVSHQLRYNMLERDNEVDVIPFCVEKGIGLQAYGPLAHGLLAGEFKKGDVLKPEDWRSRYTLFEKPVFDKIMDVLEQLKPMADSYGCSLADLALKWVLSRKGVTTALIGMMHPWQVDENLKAVELKLSDSDYMAMDTIIEKADLGLRILPPDEYMEKTT
jgi:aryl-alcohol dehydrogenase-like predicted oxidoreductase